MWVAKQDSKFHQEFDGTLMYIHVPGALKVHLVNELNNLYHDAKITHVRPTTQMNVFFYLNIDHHKLLAQFCYFL